MKLLKGHFSAGSKQERQTWFVLRGRVDRTKSVVRKLEISELQQELAITLRDVGRDDVSAPACWTTIEARCDTGTTKENTRLRMTPLGTLRLNDEARIETSLLMSGRTKVIVREDCAQRAIDAGLFNTLSAYQRCTVVCAPSVPKNGCGLAFGQVIVPSRESPESTPRHPLNLRIARMRSMTSSGLKVPSS